MVESLFKNHPKTIEFMKPVHPIGAVISSGPLESFLKVATRTLVFVPPEDASQLPVEVLPEGAEPDGLTHKASEAVPVRKEHFPVEETP